MPVLTLEESNYVGPIEDDTILRVRVTNVKFAKQNFKDDDGNDVMKCEFAFQVEDPSSLHDGQRLWGKTSTSFNTHPECRLRNWAQEIMGQELVAGYELDTDILVGQSCRAIVGAREYKKDGEDKVANFVKDVLRLGAGHAFASVDEEPF